jgi:ATP-dependent DNA helicase PIF1
MALEMAIAELVGGNNILLHAPGGYGKSHILMSLKAEFGDLLELSATTGSAAVGITGRTVHSVIPGFMHGTYERLCKYANIAKRLLDIHYLVIDEVSMLSADVFEQLDTAVRAVYKILAKKYHTFHNVTRPFAGIQIILSGDFLQIPPVSGRYIFESDLFWHMGFIKVPLTIAYRFTDPEYAEILNRIRVCTHTPADLARLQTRATTISAVRTLPIVKILAKHAQVASINNHEMKKLTEKKYVHAAVDKGNCKSLDDIIPVAFEYCTGARVMLRININADNLSNGDIGTITDCTEAYITIMFDRGIRHTLSPIKVKRKAGDALISRTQFPLNIAYAITIHKSQGMTFESIIVDMRDIFGPGMAYVAMSRVRSLAGLHIVNFDASKFVADHVVLNMLARL